METTFHNVTITIEAEDSKAAYTKLCEMFHPLVSKGELEYTTDFFTTDNTPDSSGDTSELFPNLDDAPPPYPEFCPQKDVCAGLSSCPRDPNCCE